MMNVAADVRRRIISSKEQALDPPPYVGGYVLDPLPYIGGYVSLLINLNTIELRLIRRAARIGQDQDSARARHGRPHIQPSRPGGKYPAPLQLIGAV